MRSQPLTLLLVGLIAAALFAVGVKGYWLLQDRSAAVQLHAALWADYQQCRQGIARTMVMTPSGLMVSQARILYDRPGNLLVEYINPRLAVVMVGRAAPGQPTAAGKRAIPMPVVVRQVVRLAPPPRELLPGSGLANYRARYLGKGLVAGRPVKIIGLADKATGQLLRVYWIDRQSGVLLRQDRLDEAGRLVASTEFLRIAFLPTRARTQDSPAEATARAAMVSLGLDELSRRVGFRVLLPSVLPQGFRLTDSHLFPCPCGCGGTSAHLYFSDGVRGFSVFEAAPRHAKCVLSETVASYRGQPLPGPSPALRAVVARRNNLLLIVVGDLDPETLKRIANSFESPQ